MSLPRSSPVWVVLALLASGCAPATAGTQEAEPATRIEVSIDERFYEVGGVTPWELNRELRQNGPRDDDQAERRWFGATDFKLRYRYDPMPWGEGCRAGIPHVHVELVTTLPDWPDRSAAPAPLRRDWDLFLRRLREHERGHQRIAIVMGQELLRAVEALRSTDCETLRVEARRLASAFESAVELEQRSWDHETRHGLVEGS